MLIKINILIFFILIINNCLCGLNNPITIKLFHKFDLDQEYTERGLVNLKYVSNKYIGNFKQLKSLSDNELTLLNKSSTEDNNYYIKAVSFNDKNEVFKTSTTFIKSCLLYTSSLSEQLVVNLDFENNFISLFVLTENAYCDFKNFGKVDKFNSTVNVFQTLPGPTPDTQTYIQRLELERQEKIRGESVDNRSFIAKYWIYILPISILFLISSAANPEGGGNGN